jgi:hypothetical protein
VPAAAVAVTPNATKEMRTFFITNDGSELRRLNFNLKNLYLCKGCGAVCLKDEFPTKCWERNAISDFIGDLKQTGSVIQKPGSSRSKAAQTAAHIDAVNDPVLS